jgi:tRNA pseudouridine32 synthase/23S rRNA pseudouridine746 synthase/23S rRNA pseudouridine1911/1915/1917 synthase
MKQTKFKPPPKRHQPHGMSIVYEDRDIIVVDKKGGLLTISNDKVSDKTAYFLLTNYVRKGNYKSKNRIFIVHRLDQETTGILIFAKTPQAKNYLQDNWQNFKKIYYAAVEGILAEKEGIISSYLTENNAHKMYSTSNKEIGKLAKTAYKVIKESDDSSLLEIELLTGRKNQIRAHLSEKGHPVINDKKYGKKQPGMKHLALQAYSLTITHPYTKKEMTFTANRRQIT